MKAHPPLHVIRLARNRLRVTRIIRDGSLMMHLEEQPTVPYNLKRAVHRDTRLAQVQQLYACVPQSGSSGLYASCRRCLQLSHLTLKELSLVLPKTDIIQCSCCIISRFQYYFYSRSLKCPLHRDSYALRIGLPVTEL